MGKLRIAILAGAMTASACSAAAGAPASSGGAAAAPPATSAPTSITLEVKPSTVPATPNPTAKPSEPIPDAMLGAWYHPAPAYWWFLRSGSPTCVTVAHTDLDCVAYQVGNHAAYVGAASMDGRLIRIAWTRGYCAGQETDFGTGTSGDTLKLFDTEGDCGGDNFVLTRAGTGTAPSAPPPPDN